MMFFHMASNCVRYVSTMDGIMVTGMDWVNVKTLAELNKLKITKPMMRRLRVIETLLIKESVGNANQRNKTSR